MRKIFIIIALLLSLKSQSQTTIITHGWCDPTFGDAITGWMHDMAVNIRDHFGGRILLYNKQTGNFDYQSGSGTGAILLFDWRIESTLNVLGYSETCGNALFAALMKGYLHGDFNLQDLHFIAHSRGTVVQGEAVERLLVNGFPVEHVTNVDAHDWGVVNTICADFDANPTLNQMGVIGWIGVNFYDSYWQDNPIPLTGRKVDGTYSKYVGGVLDGFNHVMIPSWYGGTVNDLSVEGFKYAKLAGGVSLRPAPNYGTAILPILDYNDAGIANGDFERGTDNYSYIPGWSYHGGVGTAFMESGHLKLNSGGYNRQSNRFYIPSNANNITFDYKVQTAASGTPPATDKLVVKIDNLIISNNIYLNTATSGYNHVVLNVRSLRNSVHTIEFIATDPNGGHSSLSSETWIDNVKFEVGICLGRDTTLCYGDTLTLNAGNIGKLTGVTYLWSNGRTTKSIKVTTPGQYWVMGNKNGILYRDTVNVNFTTPPVVDLGNPLTACMDQTPVLDAGNPNCSYLWNTFDVTRHLPVLSTGFYQVTVTNHACPPASDSVIVNIVPKPILTLAHDTTICRPIIIGAIEDTTNRKAMFFNGLNTTITGASPLSTTNNFTVEAWIRPLEEHEIDVESNTGTSGVIGKNYVIYPAMGDDIWGAGHAGMGISAGTNGISIYEYAQGYLAPLLVWQGTINGWTHIAVVYNSKRPYLYVNGKLVRRGMQSTKDYVHPSVTLGGGTYGHFMGYVDEFRIWDHVNWQAMIYMNMCKRVTGSEAGLLLNWSADDYSTNYVYDPSPSNNNGRINGATISSNVPFAGEFDNLTYHWNTGATSATITTTPHTSFTYILTASNPDGCSVTDTINIEYLDTLCPDFGINEIENSIRLYPNPTSSFLSISSSSWNETADLRIFNLQGQAILETKAIPVNNSYQLNVASMKQGIYYLRLTASRFSLRKAFIVEK